MSAIHIGLINNMSGSAMDLTERQFRTLLQEAAGGTAVHLSLFALPGVPRPREDADHIENGYGNIERLWAGRLDGIIVTGAEPLTSNLTEEPLWTGLKTLLEWAEHNTYSSIWSCLAAHAAVLHLDGIQRRPLNGKLVGVFECAKVAGNSPLAWLTAGTPARFCMPHSRWNGVAETAVTTYGYQVLTRSSETGVDAFAKFRRSLFVLFQGHPEYDADTLLLEYRRDIRRFLRRERSAYPLMPKGCFTEEQAAVFGILRERALSYGAADHSDLLLEDFPLEPVKMKNHWRSAAVGIYRNWLRYLSERKAAERGVLPYAGASLGRRRSALRSSGLDR
jgi:homoserine O-succinyltransferase